MVERYQSVQAITEQLEQGYHYLLALEDGQPCGFCGYHRETDRMFLSKIYIRKDFRRRGIASAFLKQVTEESHCHDQITAGYRQGADLSGSTACRRNLA